MKKILTDVGCQRILHSNTASVRNFTVYALWPCNAFTRQWRLEAVCLWDTLRLRHLPAEPMPKKSVAIRQATCLRLMPSPIAANYCGGAAD